jgi:hypothetical protein
VPEKRAENKVVPQPQALPRVDRVPASLAPPEAGCVVPSGKLSSATIARLKARMRAVRRRSVTSPRAALRRMSVSLTDQLHVSDAARSKEREDREGSFYATV